jgi:hypothetical protein
MLNFITFYTASLLNLGYATVIGKPGLPFDAGGDPVAYFKDIPDSALDFHHMLGILKKSNPDSGSIIVNNDHPGSDDVHFLQSVPIPNLVQDIPISLHAEESADSSNSGTHLTEGKPLLLHASAGTHDKAKSLNKLLGSSSVSGSASASSADVVSAPSSETFGAIY